MFHIPTDGLLCCSRNAGQSLRVRKLVLRAHDADGAPLRKGIPDGAVGKELLPVCCQRLAPGLPEHLLREAVDPEMVRKSAVISGRAQRLHIRDGRDDIACQRFPAFAETANKI